MNNEIDWRDAFNIAKLQRRKLYLSVAAMIREARDDDEKMDEIEREEVKKNKNKVESGDGRRKVDVGAVQFLAKFPRVPQTLPNHLLEREQLQVAYYKKKKKEWKEAGSRSKKKR